MLNGGRWSTRVYQKQYSLVVKERDSAALSGSSPSSDVYYVTLGDLLKLFYFRVFICNMVMMIMMVPALCHCVTIKWVDYTQSALNTVQLILSIL